MFSKKTINIAAIAIAGAALLASGIVMIADRANYASYESKYNKEESELRATFPQRPKEVVLDGEFVTYDADGIFQKSKSKYKKDYTFYARDAAIAPANSDVAEEYVKVDDSFLGEAISGLDRKGGAITFNILAETHGYSDVDVALRTNWVDDKGVYHALPKLGDYIKVQVNGLEVDTSKIAITESREFSHMVFKDNFLLAGQNAITFTTSAYNDFANKDTYLYVMPDIRNITVMSDVKVYLPTYEFDTGDFPTSYRLVDMPDYSFIKAVKRTGVSDNPKLYVVEEKDGSKLNTYIDYESSEVVIKCSPAVVEKIHIDLDKTAESNTLVGKLNGKDATMVITSSDTMKVTVDGEECTAKVALSGKGLASIKVLEKLSGSDEAFSLLPKKLGMDEKDGVLSFVPPRYFKSTTKANTGTGGPNGPSQTGDTYFAINCKDYLTAFWNWTYSGDEACCLKCTYSMEGSKITLKSCLESTRDEWQYLSNKTFTVTEISFDDIPSDLMAKEHFTIYED
ncbi:MAG: hypothetical protein J6328_07545 [Bacilli bacterium]|nr:hypothetical protein [Bacilli bacterium]